MLARLYAEVACGAVGEDEAALLEARIMAQVPMRPLRAWAPRIRQRVRKRDPEHRRRLAYSGPLPPQLAARFTLAQVAVLRIVADTQPCRLSVREIAARAGCAERTVQNTIRLAKGDGLVRVQERRVSAARSDTNIVTVISPEWLAWIRRGGCKRNHPSDTRVYEKETVKNGDARNKKRAALHKAALTHIEARWMTRPPERDDLS